MTISTLPARRTATRLSTLHPLRLWHLLSLDAPTVAAVWTFFASQTACIPRTACPMHRGLTAMRGAALDRSLPAPAAMFLGVWVLYLADRLLDSRALASSTHLEPRHLFHDTHRPLLTLVAVLAAVVLLPLVPHAFTPASIHLYLLLSTALVLWLAVIHLRAPRIAKPLPKELAVGLFFSTAVFTPVLVLDPRAFLLPAFFFALLCTLNCVFIYAWEHPFTHAAAHPTTQAALRHRISLTLACAVATLLPVPLNRAAAPLLLALSLAAALLLGLNSLRAQLHPTTLRAAADLVLLTPVLFLPISGRCV